MAKNKMQQVQIISGKSRGRKLPFPELDGLRPTLGRTRETLMNWLRPDLPGATCLDLFAGSGALAFEALSNGASSAVFVESNPRVCAALKDNATKLGLAQEAEIIQGNGVRYLQSTQETFDLIFLDPPFGDRQLLDQALAAICQGKLARRWIYLESDQPTFLDDSCTKYGVPPYKETRSGQTVSALIQVP